MQKYIMFILNLFATTIEYILLFLFFTKVLHASQLAMIIILSLIFLFLLGVNIYASFEFKKLKNDSDHSSVVIDNLIAKANNLYNTKINVAYIKTQRPNVAWCHGKTIFINESEYIDNSLIEGIVAHELGHAISGFSSLGWIASCRLSNLLSQMIFMLIIAGVRKDWKDFVIAPICGTYYIFSFVNFLCLFPFCKEEEHLANKIAISLGHGNELRCYYSNGIKNENNKWINRTSFYHPKVKTMIERMNKIMNLNKYESSFFYAKDVLYLCTLDSKTVTLPENIKYLNGDCFTSKNIIKLRANSLLELTSYNLRNQDKLEELIVPNLNQIQPLILSKNKALKNIKTNDTIYRILKDSTYFKEGNIKLQDNINKHCL